MKKFLGLLLSSLAVITLASCTDPKQSSDSKADNPSSVVEIYYHVTFVNYDDALLYEVDVKEGEAATYSGETPTKEEDDEFTYEFEGWDQDLTNIQSDVTTYAQYTATGKEGWGPIIWF